MAHGDGEASERRRERREEGRRERGGGRERKLKLKLGEIREKKVIGFDIFVRLIARTFCPLYRSKCPLYS